jgi:hypothetical protein
MTITIEAESKIYLPGIEAALDGCLGSLDNIANVETEQRQNGCVLEVEIECEDGAEYDEGIAYALEAWAEVTEGIASIEME